MSGSRHRSRHLGPVACFVGSAVALLVAPTLMPSGYSWVSHSTSEAAAQGLSGAWLARLGFLMFGFGVIWLVGTRREWSTWERVAHGTFGVLMVAAAAFSHRPFIPGVPYDATEDVLHSISASGMGFAFAFGVVAVALHRESASVGQRISDGLAVLASVAIPLGMTASSGSAGLLQRGMFVVAYLWYGAEALSRGTSTPSTTIDDSRITGG